MMPEEQKCNFMAPCQIDIFVLLLSQTDLAIPVPPLPQTKINLKSWKIGNIYSKWFYTISAGPDHSCIAVYLHS